MSPAMRRITYDDERDLSAREMGHTYGDGAVIVAEFEHDPDLHIFRDKFTETVRFKEQDGCGVYFDQYGGPLSTHARMTAWRYATPAEIAEFEASEEEHIGS